MDWLISITYGTTSEFWNADLQRLVVRHAQVSYAEVRVRGGPEVTLFLCRGRKARVELYNLKDKKVWFDEDAIVESTYSASDDYPVITFWPPDPNLESLEAATKAVKGLASA